MIEEIMKETVRNQTVEPGSILFFSTVESDHHKYHPCRRMTESVHKSPLDQF